MPYQERHITVDTKLVALLGTPLSQSVSYLTQNQVYSELGLNYYYFPVELPRAEQLGTVIAAFREMNFAGFAITKPYKEKVIPYLDRLDSTAERMGACNTVVKEDGALVGYNTDGIGFTRALEEEHSVKIRGKRIFSYGAGGAARAVLFQLAAQGAGQITIAAIDGTAQHLANDLNRYYPGLCRGVDMDQREILAQGTSQADLVLNLTGIGMAPHLNETPVDSTWMRPGQLCFDAIYNPAKTRFLEDAEQANCQIVNGLGMVIYQGLAQIELWTGVRAEPDIMYRALNNTR